MRVAFRITSRRGITPFSSSSQTLDKSNVILPFKHSLSQNYPNPFNPFTVISYALEKDGLVNLSIFDMTGNIVKTLVNSSQTAGYKSIEWNATNNQNEPVSAGLYLYRVILGELSETKKMVLLK